MDFLLEAAGGGISSTDGVPRALCDSEETRLELEALNYVADLRLGGTKIDTLTSLFDRLDEIIKLRCEAFLKLCETSSPDYGFLCFRVTTTVQYLAMSEIEVLLAREEIDGLSPDLSNQDSYLNPAQERICAHYELLDQLLKKVFEKLNPKDWLFCADHGASQYKYKINVNPFLVEAGFQQQPPG